MIDIRAGILAIALCLTIFAVVNQPRPVKDNQVPFCVITEKVAVKDQFGNWHTGWGAGLRPVFSTRHLPQHLKGSHVGS